ncbi:exodeoxyribonuclease III [Sulfuracidifex metallicus]|uniref:exodeoxyribonuclease III n=1 Tax=Sulfuracidifex metallicus TaxID=47303 RepID=UPI0022741C98|nr:exodeoxyribonuclease III [Sulfuracidifex metallicus]MCY0850205.1 exodeoxyribonuclease III [Sulfuracidifex metallicus]
MKLLSWNFNSLRTTINKGLLNLIKTQEYDVLMFQGAKTNQVPLDFSSYKVFLNPAKKKGYSGVMTLTKTEPLSVKFGMGIRKFDDEGRMITCEVSDFNVINVYFPNAGEGLKRLNFKMSFNKAFEQYVNSLPKPSIICGDFNVAHEEIDIARPKDNVNHAGHKD